MADLNIAHVRILTTFSDTSTREYIISGENLPTILGKISKFMKTSAGEITNDNFAEVFNDYDNNSAFCNYSHAEGSHTIAFGNYSHSEGNSTSANGEASHTEGTGTTAGSPNQHVQGKYNVIDSSGAYAFIIGNGTSANNRSNAIAIDWNGKLYINNSLVGVDVNQLSIVKYEKGTSYEKGRLVYMNTGELYQVAGTYTSCNIPGYSTQQAFDYDIENNYLIDLDANSVHSIKIGASGTSIEPSSNTLTLPIDAEPTEGSNNLITSGAIWNLMYDIINPVLEAVLGGNTPPVVIDTWNAKTWNGNTLTYGDDIWTDGTNIYYSNGSNQYVLDKSTSTWSPKTWTGLTEFYESYIWTDGTDIYYSSGPNQYVLDKSTSTWSPKTWNGVTSFAGYVIWTDGTNIYYSNSINQYVLDKTTSTWSTKTWNGLTEFNGNRVWTDGDNIYYSDDSTQYVLDKTTSTWNTKTWNGLSSFSGYRIWTDGTDIYYSNQSNQYVLDKTTSTWNTKTWTGLTSFDGSNTWTDGTNIYSSQGSSQYVLDGFSGPISKTRCVCDCKPVPIINTTP